MRHALRLILFVLLFVSGQQRGMASLPNNHAWVNPSLVASPCTEVELEVPELRLDNPRLYGDGDRIKLWTKFDPEGLYAPPMARPGQDWSQMEEGLEKYGKPVAEMAGAFIPVVSQIQSAATLRDPNASTAEKVVAGFGMIPEVGGIVKDVAAVVKDVSKIKKAAETVKETAQVVKNAEKGAQRALKTGEELSAENPGKVVQKERLLRDAEGNKVVDPVTREGRRVDHVVIDREANTAKPYETTGQNVSKDEQLAKEARVRAAGGNYIRDKETRKMVPVDGVSEVRRQE